MSIVSFLLPSVTRYVLSSSGTLYSCSMRSIFTSPFYSNTFYSNVPTRFFLPARSPVTQAPWAFCSGFASLFGVRSCLNLFFTLSLSVCLFRCNGNGKSGSTVFLWLFVFAFFVGCAAFPPVRREPERTHRLTDARKICSKQGKLLPLPVQHTALFTLLDTRLWSYFFCMCVLLASSASRWILCRIHSFYLLLIYCSLSCEPTTGPAERAGPATATTSPSVTHRPAALRFLSRFPVIYSLSCAGGFLKDLYFFTTLFDFTSKPALYISGPVWFLFFAQPHTHTLVLHEVTKCGRQIEL